MTSGKFGRLIEYSYEARGEFRERLDRDGGGGFSHQEGSEDEEDIQTYLLSEAITVSTYIRITDIFLPPTRS